MKRAWVAVIVLGVACGKSKTKDKEGSGTNTGSAAAVASGAGSGSGSAMAEPPKAELGPCPKDDALKAKTAELFGVQVDAVDFTECVVGKFPNPAWVIAARYTKANKADDESGVQDRVALVDAAGKIISDTEEEVPFGAVDSSGTEGYQAVDLDGDKTDELVYTFASDKRGYLVKVLVAQRFKKTEWETVLTRTYDYDNSAADAEGGIVTCEASWKIDDAGADGKRTITFEPKAKVKKGTSVEDCVLKKETWALGADGKYAKK